MAQSSVDLIVNAVKAINPLRAVAAASKKAEQAIDDLKKKAKATGDQLASMARKGKKGLSDLAARAAQATKKFGKLGKAAALAAAAAGAAALLKFSFGKAGELERQTKSLQVLTGSLETAKGIISDLQAFGAVTPFTSTELIETAKRLKAFGFETKQVVDITKRLSDVAGATGADLSGIATAFGQIQAKGRLQGEELLQLQERGVALQDELKTMYGLTGTEFSKALEKGQISAKAAEVALIRLTEQGGKYANGAVAQSDTLFGKLSTLQDAFQRFGQNIGKVLDPIFKGIIDFLTTITNQINNLFREAEIDREAKRQLSLATGGASGVSKVSRANISGRTAERAELEALKKQLREQGFAAAPTIPEPKIPSLLPGRAGSGAGTGKTQGKTPEEIAAEATKGQIANLKEQAILATGLTQQEKDMLKLKIEIQKVEENRSLVGDKLTDEHIERLKVAFAQKNIEQDLNNDRERAAERLRDIQEEAAKKKKEADDAEAARVQELESFYESVGSTIQSGIVDGIMGAIDGSKSLKESLSGLLKQVGGMFLNAGIGGLGKSLKIPGFGMAEGGYVSGPTSAVIGEGGEPEYVIPESKMRESMARYSRGSRGAGVIPDNEGATAANAAGGGSGGSVDVRFNVERINSVDYVTASEFQAGIAQAAQQGAREGERRALGSMQNSPAVRRRVRI